MTLESVTREFYNTVNKVCVCSSVTIPAAPTRNNSLSLSVSVSISLCLCFSLSLSLSLCFSVSLSLSRSLPSYTTQTLCRCSSVLRFCRGGARNEFPVLNLPDKSSLRQLQSRVFCKDRGSMVKK
eukprot:sb/3475677/